MFEALPGELPAAAERDEHAGGVLLHGHHRAPARSSRPSCATWRAWALRRWCSYGGTGAYFLDRLAPGVWRLEVMPDAVPIRDPFEKASLSKAVTQILWNEQPLQISLADLGSSFTLRGLNEGNTAQAQAADGPRYRAARRVPAGGGGQIHRPPLRPNQHSTTSSWASSLPRQPPNWARRCGTRRRRRRRLASRCASGPRLTGAGPRRQRVSGGAALLWPHPQRCP